MKGTYILLIEIKDKKNIKIGKLGVISFEKGFYAYVGSALNNLEKRIQRHIRKNKNIYWHIDYLLQIGNIIDVFYLDKNKKDECNIAKKLEDKLSTVTSFGCSDCKCKTHLFYGSKKDIEKAIIYFNMNNYCNAKT